jgi:hypothetical protein
MFLYHMNYLQTVAKLNEFWWSQKLQETTVSFKAIFIIA